MNMQIQMLLSATGYERLFDLDFQLLSDSVLTIIAVFVLFLVLSYNLFNPARKVLEDRKNRIRNDLESAQNDKEAALALKQEYEEKLENVDREVEQILSDARQRALANESKVVEAAKKEAAAIIERAHIEAELEKKRVMDEAKQEMIDVAALMAKKVVSRNIDTTIQDSLVDETLKELGEATWQK